MSVSVSTLSEKPLAEATLNLATLQHGKASALDCSDDSEAIKATRSSSSAKATLTGRTLSFTGVKSAATAEIINSQGQVVLRGTIDITTSSLNLATLDAGAYMIRVTGKNFNFAKEIMLK